MQTLKTIKPGDTFAFYANIEDDAGTPLAGLADTMKCQIRNSIDELIADVGITDTNTRSVFIWCRIRLYGLLVCYTQTYDLLMATGLN